MPEDAFNQSLDRLYAAALDDFLPMRKREVAALRTAGDAAAARAVGAASKPTRTAWALNQVARREPAVVRALLQAREAAAAPHAGGDDLRAATREYRDRLNDVVRAARDVLAEAGVELNAGQARRIAETLQAASAEDGDTRARLVAGRLVHDVEVEDPFGGLVAEGADGGTPRRPAPERKKDKADEREAARAEERRRKEQAERERAIEAARARLSALEESAREARAEARTAETAADRAAREAERVRQRVTDVESRLVAARAELARLKSS